MWMLNLCEVKLLLGCVEIAAQCIQRAIHRGPFCALVCVTVDGPGVSFATHDSDGHPLSSFNSLRLFLHHFFGQARSHGLVYAI